MNAIENLSEVNYFLLILGFFAVLFAVKEVIEILSYFKKKLGVNF